MDRSAFATIVREICELLDQQMQVISQRGLPALSDEERRAYEKRRGRIAMLRSGLNAFNTKN